MIKSFLKDAFAFIKDNPAILYSLAVIIILPLVFYLYTFWTINSFRKAIETNINSQSFAIRDILGSLLFRDFPAKDNLDQETLQKTIDSIAAQMNGNNSTSTIKIGKDPSVENIRVIVKDGRNYKIIAAQDHSSVGKQINVASSLNGEGLVAYSWANPVQEGEEVSSEIEVNGKKYSRQIKAFIDPGTQDVYALVTADISLDEINGLIAGTVNQAYVVLAAIILLSLFLVFQHTRLFSYVNLSKNLKSQIIAKDDFIRMATHELRSPLTVMNMYTEALKEELLPITNEEQRQYIERVLISIRNLRDLMSDILEVSHIQQGRVDFKPEKIVPGAVVKEIVDGIRPKAVEKGLTLSLEGENFPYNINVNPVCFKRIITNLVENSVKYTPAGKVMVSIKVETAKKRCVITVQDTGFGISAEGQQRLFEQFYRVKTKENEGIPGTGLGLWMSREMARRMDGDIMLESIEQMGSRFFVFFPLADK